MYKTPTSRNPAGIRQRSHQDITPNRFTPTRSPTASSSNTTWSRHAVRIIAITFITLSFYMAMKSLAPQQDFDIINNDFAAFSNSNHHHAAFLHPRFHDKTLHQPLFPLIYLLITYSV